MKIRLYTDKCISCGTCAAIAPELFSIDSGVVSMKKDPKTFTDEQKKLAHEVAIACPTGAIEITEE